MLIDFRWKGGEESLRSFIEGVKDSISLEAPKARTFSEVDVPDRKLQHDQLDVKRPHEKT